MTVIFMEKYPHTLVWLVLGGPANEQTGLKVCHKRRVWDTIGQPEQGSKNEAPKNEE